MRKFVESTVLVAAKQILVRGTLVLVSMLMARSLSLDALNAYSYFQITTATLASYAAFGFPVANTRFLAEFLASDRQRSTPLGLVWTCYFAVISAVCLGIFLVPRTLVGGDLGIDVRLLTAGVFAVSVGGFSEGAVMALERYRALALWSVVFAVVFMIASFWASAASSYRIAIWGMIVATLVKVGGEAFVLRKELPVRRILSEVRFSMRDSSMVLGLVAPMGLSSLVFSTGTWALGWVNLHRASEANQFAQFAIAIQWFSLAMFIPSVVAQVTFPRIVRMIGADDQSGLTKGTAYLIRSVVATFACSLAVVVVGFASSPWIRLVYGDLFAEHRYMLGWFLAAALPYSVINAVGNFLVIRGDQWIWLIFNLVHQGLAVSLGYWLTTAGASGSAFALFVAGSLFSAVVLLRARALGRASNRSS